MMMARLLDGYDAAASKGEDSNQPQASAVSTESPSTSTSRPPLPRVSPISYTSHAMMLQLQEYRSRVRSAFESTYRHPLTASNTPRSLRKRDAHSGNYCRTRVLESSRLLFAQQARNGAPAASIAASSPRTSIKGGGVAFHRTTTSSRATAKSNLFALGPGQYDIVPRRPATTGSVKFSPADRFPEHSGGGIRDLHAPGPGQYLPDDKVTVKRSARVVFSQLPRQTETAAPPRASVATPPATADVVSSYYFVPTSGFVSPADSVSKTGGGIPNWSRSARFPGRKERFRQISSNLSPAVDYISRNKARIESMSAQRRRIQHPVSKIEEKICSVRRRDSVFCTSLGSPDKENNARRRRSSVGSVKDLETSETGTVSQAWSTLVVLSAAQMKLVKLLVASAVLHRLRQAQETRYKRVTFESWTHVRSRDSMRALAAALIARGTFRFRLGLRVQRKTRAAKLLRIFLSGLSFDVRFAMAVRRMQRRIILLQRWWRHARLVVRAREQCLACKWLAVEQRLRTEAIAQMPHLQRVFQPPSTAITPPRASSASTKRKASTTGAMTVESQVPLHKLLHLPKQKRWFNARFVLGPDGSLRGYAVPEPDAENTENAEERLVVEVKHFRCHAHGFANLPFGSTHAEDEGESDTKPYLMVFKPGASRFVLITDTTSLILAPLLDWKEKLERVAGYSNGLSYSGSGSQSDVADMLSQTDNLGLDDFNEEPVVQISSSRRMSISANVERSGSVTQGRRRSSRCHLRRSNLFQPIAEGNLAYYVVDLLRDCPRIPAPIVWSALRDKLREERKNFRSDIYRFKLEIARYQQHEHERRQLVVLDKFKEFFTMERPRRPHFRSLISNRQMEALVRETIEFVKTTQPSNPKVMLPS
ncbi:hypothetical protein JG687_00004645 [Phytophthora cactorum]|uniref:Uncharacterized protein n=1 Tax=Phytophthora cactorum TaxID=29920 RepID=A0A8T1UPA3_9STRA|nr:hypothetical protein PC120_g3859 [Phytophthora cactorum]KAG3074333.1 hypothetical protein PC121_g8379 [Phytophthora cactorum]KAG4053056.1 hypothetical protein PC123_g11805 [Phytophthora cactorum]KAG6966822.1 hypothetical protein JG687_00004645 [Phytophthora cactorum]